MNLKGFTFLLMMFGLLAGIVFGLMVVNDAESDTIDNDPYLKFCWSPPSNWPQVVAWYELKLYFSGFSPSVDSAATAGADTFLVYDTTPWMPYLTRVDSATVRAYNAWGDRGPDSDASAGVDIQIIPGKPSAPWWVPENE